VAETDRSARAHAVAPARLVALLALIGVGCGGPPQDLSEAQLSAVVAREQPGLERCYRNALESHPYERDITMEATIEIEPSGRVKNVKLEGGGGLPGMSPCLLAAIRSWTFPTAPDATATSLPIVFRPEVQREADPEAVQEAVRQALGASADPQPP
jgi:hypothetical protein